MAAAAELRDLLAPRLADEPLGRAHGLHPLLAGIASMTGRTAEPLGLVDVVLEGLGGRHQPIVAGFEMTHSAVVAGRLRGHGAVP
jgi:hypothetical protein